MTIKHQKIVGGLKKVGSAFKINVYDDPFSKFIFIPNDAFY